MGDDESIFIKKAQENHVFRQLIKILNKINMKLLFQENCLPTLKKGILINKLFPLEQEMALDTVLI